MNQLHIKSKLGDYDVFFEEDFAFLKKLGGIKNQLLLIDMNVYNLYKDDIDANFEKENIFLFDAVEENKNLENVTGIYEYLIRCQAKRNITIISKDSFYFIVEFDSPFSIKINFKFGELVFKA